MKNKEIIVELNYLLGRDSRFVQDKSKDAISCAIKLLKENNAESV